MTQLQPGDMFKGHGTHNDFVIVYDPFGTKPLSAQTVAQLCNRRGGIGADGLIRVVPSNLLGAPEVSETSIQETSGADTPAAGESPWFMDYRNADGSIAEMCGNGVRVFAHFLTVFGLVTATSFPVGTRAGIKNVTVGPSPLDPSVTWYTVDMGYGTLPAVAGTANMTDSLVNTTGLDVARPGLSVDMGNPHTVVALATPAELEGLNLCTAPQVDPHPPHGTNVEYLVVDPHSGGETGRLRMRVFERGVGETFACGTGACATALAAMRWGGDNAPRSWYVEQPGGTVRIDIEGTPPADATTAAGGISEPRVLLSGPAELVARFSLL